MVNPLGEETTLETSSLRLEGIKYDVSELESIAIILRDEETLRGLYRLTFADSFLYAGQSKNVVTRFAQHRRRWDDIVAFEFFPLPVGDLSAAEKLLIGVTERTNSLRNIKDTRRPLGTDEIQISVEEHLSIALPWERSKRVRPQQGINSASTLKFAELSNYDIYPLLRQVVGWYLYNAVPDVINTQRHLWTITCLPSTNKTANSFRLLSLNVGNLETLVAVANKEENGAFSYTLFINGERTEDIFEEEDLHLQWVYSYEKYNLTPVTRLVVTLPAIVDAIYHVKPIPQLEEMLEAAYRLNVKLMRSGNTMFKRFHSELLASDSIAAALTWQGEDWHALET